MTDRPECAVAECYVPRQHESECGDDRCTGCVPGLAMAGLRVCQHHRDQIARGFDRLPRLYAELAGCLAPYRSPQAPRSDGGRSVTTAQDGADEAAARAAERSKAMTEPGLAWMRSTSRSRLSETPDVLNPAVYEIRRDIERKFWDWAAYIATARQFTMPSGDVAVLGRFLETSVDWLAADRLAAPAIGARLQELLSEATHLRNRVRASGKKIGECPLTESTTTLTIDDAGRAHRKTEVSEPCGGVVRYDREEQRACREMGLPYQVTCPRCGKAESLLWWQQEIVGDIEPPALLPAVQVAWMVADSLALELAAAGRTITPSTIGKWKYDETQRPGTGISPVACDLRSRRDLFDRAVVEAFARNRLKLNPESRTA